MKKKIATLLIAGTLSLSLIACGGESDSSSGDTTKTESTEETQSEVTYQTILDH